MDLRTLHRPQPGEWPQPKIATSKTPTGCRHLPQIKIWGRAGGGYTIPFRECRWAISHLKERLLRHHKKIGGSQ